jgi:hypothetical protein
MKLTIPRRQEIETVVENEVGQTMAEYSVVLTLVVLVIGMGAFVVLALSVVGEYQRVTGLFT